MKVLLLSVAVLMLLLAACGKAPSTSTTSSSTVPTPAASASATASTATPLPNASPITNLPSAMTGSTATGTVVYLPGTGGQFETAAAITATSWLTSDEKTFLVSELARVQSGNSCAALTVQSYRVADLINGQVFDGGLTGSCGGGGYAILWGKVSGTWKVLVTGQNPPGCADIRTAGWASTIPKDFFGGQCYEKGSTTLVAYKP